jgi:hypothetical protein
MAETFILEPTEPDEDYDAEGLGMEITGELIKSYGFRRENDGSWGWSLENIQQAYHDDPFFTMVDWAATIPVLSWAKGATAVLKGAGAAGRAYKGR